ncbi:MAG TPA: hypothetical protein VFN87_18260 [Solirubrobacteraceae bacterium]|nr:hypothetical protein [Solirubrobacteraceae bacterium]
MTSLSRQLPRRRALLGIDLLLVVWVVGWIVVGLLIAHEVNGLARLSTTVEKAGQAAEASGTALHALSAVPFVGHTVGQASARVIQAGQSAVASGQASRSSVGDLATLLGIAVALIPSIPVLAVYVPLRIGRARERLVVGAALAEIGDNPEFQAFLARRALETLPYRRLRWLVHHPWQKLDARQRADLAAAELQRLGLTRRASRSGLGG